MSALVSPGQPDQPGPDSLIPIPAELVAQRVVTRAIGVDVDFSLAIHNRTGKYFIGQELLRIPDLAIGRSYFWRQARTHAPEGIIGKIIGRLQHLEIAHRTTGGPMSLLPRRKPNRPLLHLDPFTVPTTRLSERDAVLIHDLGPVTHPDLFGTEISEIYSVIYAEIARANPHLIFVSSASQNEFARLYPAARPRSSRVIYPPIRPNIDRIGEDEPIDGLNPPFLLTVGSIGRRKNQAMTIRAYARSGLYERGVRYAICGGLEPGHEEVAALAEATPGVHLLSYVTDGQLSWLYGNAVGFVLASRLEGFGMPVSEAVSNGLVPLVSRDTVLTEVAGDGAIGVSVDDESEIAARMVDLATMPSHERSARLDRLNSAIERFSLSHFRNGWRHAIRDILRMA